MNIEIPLWEDFETRWDQSRRMVLDMVRMVRFGVPFLCAKNEHIM